MSSFLLIPAKNSPNATTILREDLFAYAKSVPLLESTIMTSSTAEPSLPQHSHGCSTNALVPDQPVCVLYAASPLYCLVRQQGRACGATKRQRAARLRLAIKPGKWCQEISCEAYASKIARVDAWALCVRERARVACARRDSHLVTTAKMPHGWVDVSL